MPIHTLSSVVPFTIPNGLREAARQGELSVLVGAGLSIASKLPGWVDLLEGLCEDVCPIKHDGVVRLISENRLLDAAEFLAADASPTAIHASLQKRLDIAATPSRLHDAVFDLDPALVLTTNFDSLLESAAHIRYGKIPRVVLGDDDAALGAINTRGRICKLHGDLNHPSSIVLTTTQFHNFTARALLSPSGLWGHITRHPCLVLGYSFSDPDIQLLLHAVRGAFAGFGQPWYFVTAEDRDEELLILERAYGLTPIRYDKSNGHEKPLLRLLEALSDARAEAAYVRAAPAVEIALNRRILNEVSLGFHELRNGLMRCDEILDSAQKTNNATLDSLTEPLRGIAKSIARIEDLVTSQVGESQDSDWEICQRLLEEEIERFDGPRYKIEHSTEVSDEIIIPLLPQVLTLLIRTLLDNSIEATSGIKNPRVHVYTGTVPGRDTLQLRIVIFDNGAGIQEEMRRRLFMPGHSTKGKGRGNGLFLLKSIVEQVGGNVAVSSEDHKGTSVAIVIPCRKRIEDVVPSAGTRKFRFSRRLVVVHVEDDEAQRIGVARWLEAANCEVHSFADGFSALIHVENCDRSPDVIITDLVLGFDMTGHDLIDQVRKLSPAIPAVIVSGYFSSHGAWRYENADFLEKPFAADSLLNAISKLTKASCVEIDESR